MEKKENNILYITSFPMVIKNLIENIKNLPSIAISHSEAGEITKINNEI